MMLLIILISTLILTFIISCVKLYSVEMKIMKKLKIIEPQTYRSLLWFSSRANPYKFIKFIKENKLSDAELNNLISGYKRIRHFGFIAWSILAAITLIIIICGIMFNKNL